MLGIPVPGFATAPHRRRGSTMGKHGDGKGGADGDRQQSPKESDGRWTKPVTDPPKKK